jgi:hypothetical protein
MTIKDKGQLNSGCYRLRHPFVRGIILISVFTSSYCGCDIFQTRTPQPPQQGRSNFVQPTTASIVIQNLISAVAEKDVDNYISCLSDTSFGGRAFSFVPSSNSYSQIFQSWGIEQERAYFNNLRIQSANYAAPALTLSTRDSSQLSSDSVRFSANYILYWPNRSYPQLVKGSLRFYLGHDKNQNWSIYRWEDSKTDTLTWSDLKAQASQ